MREPVHDSSSIQFTVQELPADMNTRSPDTMSKLDEKIFDANTMGRYISRGTGEVIDIRGQEVSNNIEGSLMSTEDRKLVRKIDLCLLPLLTLSYMLQFLDKQTLNFESTMGLIHDLKLHGTQYAWTSSIFYFGYLAFSYPASVLMVRFPLGKYLACTCLVWAICLTCHAATTNFAGLMVARFVLGATEASISPGFSLITG